MKCPYCNNLCMIANIGFEECKSCPVDCSFVDWDIIAQNIAQNMYTFGADDVVFYLKYKNNNCSLSFYPNNYAVHIFIPAANGMSSKSIEMYSNSLLTSNNVQEFFDRVMNLRAFL